MRKKRLDWRKKLRALRSRLGLTQAAAAAHVGVSTRAWIAWENRQRTPSATAAILIEQLAAGKGCG